MIKLIVKCEKNHVISCRGFLLKGDIIFSEQTSRLFMRILPTVLIMMYNKSRGEKIKKWRNKK